MFPTAAAAVAIWMLFRLLVEATRAERRNAEVRALIADEIITVRARLAAWDELAPRPPSSPARPPGWRPTIAR